MYIPASNTFTDRQDVIDFMQRYSFATIITVKDGLPTATHLPFIVKQSADQIILRSHLAKVNPQSDNIDGNNAMVMFMEPHAYISPKHYDKEQSVPTWNYLAVHAYGKCVLLDNEDDKASLLEETVNFYEKDYQKQWNNLPITFKQNMMKGIVAFEVIVNDLQAKKKLSQNKTEKERDSIIQKLAKADNTAEKDIAEYMEKLDSKNL